MVFGLNKLGNLALFELGSFVVYDLDQHLYGCIQHIEQDGVMVCITALGQWFTCEIHEVY